METTRLVTVLLPSEMVEGMDALAGRLARSRGWVIEQALSAYLQDEQERYRLTLVAMQDVDNGRTVDHASVLAWVQCLEPKELGLDGLGA